MRHPQSPRAPYEASFHLINRYNDSTQKKSGSGKTRAVFLINNVTIQSPFSNNAGAK
mgnify:CR=1 FL=1